ncbi:MAG: efflux RND transporter permease subunit [Sulfurihydrogenibium sp.]
MNFLINLLLKYRVLVLSLATFLFMYGIYSLKKIPLDAIPDLTDTQVIVYSKWFGQSPSVIENQITYPLVSNFMGLPNVKSVRGYSMPNYSLVYIIFKDGTDLYWARSRVLEKLSSIQNSLPKQAVIELSPDATGVGWIYQYVLVSKKRSLDELWSIQNFYLKYGLLSVENVAEVATVGGFEKEFRIILNPQKMYQFNLSLDDIVNAVKGTNVETGGKSVEINGREFIVRSKGYVSSIDDIKNTVVKDVNGIPIRLSDVANVVETPALRMGTADFNGLGNTVFGIVVMRSNANAYQTIQNVKEKLKQLKVGLPEDVEIVPVYDRSKLIEDSVNHLKKVLLEESVVVILVIALFLLSLTLGFVIVIFLVLSVLLTFIVMEFLGINSNIMSLGGIAIAIGTMVDAAIVIVESFAKKREEGKTVKDSIVESFSEVGKPIFLALLIVSVSFVPMLALKGQAGKLFHPLVLTKTLAMLSASILSLIVLPILIYYLGRGKILSENHHPLVKFLIKLYTPLFFLAVRFRLIFLLMIPLSIVGDYLIYKNIEKEFMPQLNEGVLMYMPITTAGISIQEAQNLITLQDRIIKSFPEVNTVFGKAGRADTSTDPAPLSMVETFITLKPENQWREGMTLEKLISQLDQALQIPGVVNSWTMPIRGRIDMISTGIRTPLGIKIYGKDVEETINLAKKVETALQGIEGVMSVYAERSTSSTYIDIVPDREKLSLYGLRVEDLAKTIEILFGNSPVSVYISGRERYNITLGIPRDFRQNPENLILPLQDRYIPLKAVAEVKRLSSTAEIKSENGLFVSYVYVTPKKDADILKIIDEGSKRINQEVNFPSGYYYQWSGQYEFWQQALEDLKIIVPLILLSIVVLIYLSLERVFETLLVIFTLPVSVFGGFLVMYLLGYKLSLASISGFLALLGIAAEMGIIMIIYIINSLKTLTSQEDQLKGIYEGAVKRIRPKTMTMITILVSLIPAVLLKGTGSEVISSIALPMLGGIVTSFIASLFLIPAIYSLKVRR